MLPQGSCDQIGSRRRDRYGGASIVVAAYDLLVARQFERNTLAQITETGSKEGSRARTRTKDKGSSRSSGSWKSVGVAANGGVIGDNSPATGSCHRNRHRAEPCG